MNNLSRLAAFALAAAWLQAHANPIPAPDNWRRESFDFPLAFAPSIGLEGREHVRFAPGWANFAGERGFSYVFLWDVKDIPGPALTVHGLEFALGVYFDGLMYAAAESRKVEPGRERSVVNFHPMSAVPGWRDAHAGEIYTWNGFGKGERLVLQIEAVQRTCPNARAQVFFAISKARRADAIWSDLRKARDGTPC